jgi:hypothetical protein
MTSTEHSNKEVLLDEQALQALARNSLNDSVAHLDAATLSQLNRARQQALAEVGKPFLQRHWLPLSAAAFALVAISVALPLLTSPNAVSPPAPNYAGTVEDAVLVEDLDLVLWLMESEDHAS